MFLIFVDLRPTCLQPSLETFAASFENVVCSDEEEPEEQQQLEHYRDQIWYSRSANIVWTREGVPLIPMSVLRIPQFVVRSP